MSTEDQNRCVVTVHKGVDVDALRRERLAIDIDAVVKRERPDDWRGNLVKERAVQQAIFSVLNDEEEVEKLFMVIKHQVEY
jgi:type I restriction enzyme R subunit